MDGFQRRREQKKDSIRRAALDLFGVHGIKKVSVNDIARRAGVSPVTIYNYHGSKQGLVHDVVTWVLTALEDNYAAIIHSDRPFLERWQQLLLEKNELRHLYNGELLQALISEYSEVRVFVEQEMQPRLMRLIMDFFEEGKREGILRSDLSWESIGILSQMVRSLAITDPDLYTRLVQDDRLYADFVRLLLYGMVGEQKHPELIRTIETGERKPPPSEST